MERKLRASIFVGNDHSYARVRTDGVLVARHKAVVRSEDIDRTVGHAIESARLEGVTLSPEMIVRLVHEAAGKPIILRSNAGQNPPRGM